MMLAWLVDHLPWWVVPAAGGGALLAAFIALRAFGLSAKQVWAIVGAGAAAVGAATLYQKGRRAGVASAEDRQHRADEAAVKTRDDVDNAIAGRPPEENRKRLGKWAD